MVGIVKSPPQGGNRSQRRNNETEGEKRKSTYMIGISLNSSILDSVFHGLRRYFLKECEKWEFKYLQTIFKGGQAPSVGTDL